MKKIEYREATEEERGISSIQLRILDIYGMIVYDRDVVRVDRAVRIDLLNKRLDFCEGS